MNNIDQHFMINKTAIKTLVINAQLKNNDVVLEIGFGKGNLTELLAKKCFVIAVDIDTSFNFVNNNVKVIHGNILNLIDGLKFNKIVSNIPYSISEPLLWKTLGRDEIERMVLTYGINFAKIITNKDNKLGIIANCFYETKIIKILSKRYFVPEPRTDSAIVVFKKKQKFNELEKIIVELVKQKDKKIKNAFEKIFIGKLTKKEVKRKLKNIKNKKIIENNIMRLSNEKFLTLIEFLKQIILKNI
ncbi:MAG: rRNA adenine N-6-methyltransferase family protein [Candidatus Woesearchaeota archaeon]